MKENSKNLWECSSKGDMPFLQIKRRGAETMSEDDITVRDIYIARKLIAPIIRRTPLINSPVLTEHVGVPVYLKLENLQETGAFKIRGAANKLLSLTADEKARGVITFSSGSHGRAVAHMARQLGIRAVICLSKHVPNSKADAIRRLGGEPEVFGKSQDEAMYHASEMAKEQGLAMIDTINDVYIIAGQGTIGLELLEDLPEVNTVVIPLSSGGLISGTALTLKSANSSIRVIGVSPEVAPAMYHSLEAGRPVEIAEKDSLADALLGGIGLDNKYTFRMVQKYVDDIVLLSEAEIAEGMAFALYKHHLILEGGGAVGISALLSAKVREFGENIAVIITGGNVELPLLLKIAQDYSNWGS